MSYFLKQFAEKSNNTCSLLGATAGTGTFTKTIEGSDQDASSELFAASLGTATSTATTEGADQDLHSSWVHENRANVMGTLTCTESIEGTDQDENCGFFTA